MNVDVLIVCDAFQLEAQLIALLIQNMERLDESIKEEADGIHNSLGEMVMLLYCDLWSLHWWILWIANAAAIEWADGSWFS